MRRLAATFLVGACVLAASCVFTIGFLVNASPSSAAPLANQASAATVTASSQNTSTAQLATKAVDSVVSGWPGDYTKEWATDSGGSGSWLKLTWASPTTISQIVVNDRPNTDDQITAATINFSDGSQLVTGPLPNDGSALTINFSTRTVTWLQLTVNNTSGTTKNIGLAEFQVLGTAASGSPLTSTTTTQPAATTTTLPSTTTTTRPAATTTTTLPPTTTTTQAPAVTTTTVPVATSGRVITVSSSIQAAVDAAKPGDSIHVPAGTYDGLVNLRGKTDLTIYGDGAATVVKHDSSDDPIITLPLDGAQANIELRNFTVQGNYSRWVQQGICVEEAYGLKVHDIRFQDIGYCALQARSWGYDRWDTRITGLEFYNNTITRAGEFGIYVGAGVQGAYVHNNDFGACEGRMYPPHAVYIQDANAVWVYDNVAHDTLSSNGFAYKAGVQTTHGHIFNIHFDRNVSRNCFGGLWLVAAEDVTATGNDFQGCTNQAVQFWADNKRITLEGNKLGSALYNIKFATDGLWSSEIRLRNNTLVEGIPLDLCGGPSSMIVEMVGNSWQ